MSLRDFFPFPTIRPSQEAALATVEQAVRDGKHYIVIEAPTGVGKSGIAKAVADWAAATDTIPVEGDIEDFQKGAYILSTQKSLTAQYCADFQNLAEIKGKANYSCELSMFDATIDCEMGPSIGCEENKAGGVCPYKAAKGRFLSERVGVTNFSYFLAETAHVNRLPRRTFLIVDECHNAEKQILDFWSIDLTPQRVQDITGFRAPTLRSPNDQGPVRAWLDNAFLPMLLARVADLAMRGRGMLAQGEKAEAAKLFKKASAHQSLHDKLNQFYQGNPSDWFVYEDKGVLIFKRFSAAEIAHQMLLRKGQYVLFMSATILDTATFLRNLGIDAKEAVVLKLDSDFPVENRPVYAWYAGNMNRDTIEKTLPKLVRNIEKILEQFPSSKGIIHTHSYRVTDAVVGYLRGTAQGFRLITHGSGKGEREDAIERHRISTIPSVIVSPSMAEGLDLKGDLSRFQIICKVPYPALDAYTMARKNVDAQWYLLQTGLTLIQASGRSVRSNTDWAYTFILDQGFHPFFKNNYYIFSPWWSKSVRILRQEEVGEVFQTLLATARS